MQGIMLRMISLEGGEWARRRMSKTELVFQDLEETKRAEAVVSLLEKERLLVSNKDREGNVYVEPAHEELIRGWGRLREWVDDFGPENLLLLRNITRATSSWEKKEGGLWHDNPRLFEALDLAKYSDWLMKWRKQPKK